MSDSNITLNCVLKEEGLTSFFGININKNERISALKEAIWEKTKKKYDIDALSLELWNVNLPFDDEEDKEKFQRLKDEDVLDGKKLEDATIVIEKEFGMAPIEGNIHIVIDKPVFTANNLDQSLTQLLQKILMSIQKMDENIQRMDRNLQENTRILQENTRILQENTRDIQEITRELRELKKFVYGQHLHVTLHELCIYLFVEKNTTLIYERSITKPVKKRINCRCKVEDVIKDVNSKKYFIMVRIGDETRRINELADLSKWILDKEEIDAQVGNINPHKYFRAENEIGSLGTAYDYYREHVLDY